MKLGELIDFVANAKNVFGKMEKLEKSQSALSDVVKILGDRVTVIDAALKTLSVEIKHENYKETQDLFNEMRRDLHSSYMTLTEKLTAVDTEVRLMAASAKNPTINLKRNGSSRRIASENADEV